MNTKVAKQFVLHELLIIFTKTHAHILLFKEYLILIKLINMCVKQQLIPGLLGKVLSTFKRKNVKKIPIFVTSACTSIIYLFQFPNELKI